MKELLETLKETIPTDYKDIVSKLRIYFIIRIALALLILIVLIVISIEQSNLVDILKHISWHEYNCCKF